MTEILKVRRSVAKVRASDQQCYGPECERAAFAKGLCSTHYQQQRTRGRLVPIRPRQIRRDWHPNADGYIERFEPGRGMVLQHHAVMETILGRELYPWEEIHHKNGVRHDNQPSNLELWARQQPHGQRLDDLIDWVVTFYRDEIAELVSA